MTEVEPIIGFGQTRKWMQMWKELGKQIQKMPDWMREIILDDINHAIKNRIAIMEMIQNENRRLQS